MTVPSEFSFLKHGEEVFMATNGISNLLAYILIGDVI